MSVFLQDVPMWLSWKQHLAISLKCVTEAAVTSTAVNETVKALSLLSSIQLDEEPQLQLTAGETHSEQLEHQPVGFYTMIGYKYNTSEGNWH